MSGRHKKKQNTIDFLPDWVRELEEGCLRSVAEDAYYAKALADELGAKDKPNCQTSYRAGQKSLENMEDASKKMAFRCKEGDRAARKFWEVKVGARKKI